MALWASLVAQTVKTLPAVWETWVQSLGQEDLLEKGMATHSSILAATTSAKKKSGSKKYLGASLVAQRLKHLPAMWETQVQSLCWEDPLEKEMAAHSSIHAWKIPWMEEPGGLPSMGLHRVGHG